MGTVESTNSGNWSTDAASCWDSGSRPGDADDVIIKDGHNITISQDERANSVTIEDNATLTISGTRTITIDGKDGSSYSFRAISGSTISGTLNVKVEGNGGYISEQATGSINDLEVDLGSSSEVHYLDLNLSIAGNLTITEGIFNTNASSNRTLTVAKDVIIGAGSGTGDSAVLDGNASEIIINGGMKIDVTGKYDATNHANGTVINGIMTGAKAIELIAGGTFIHNNGLVHVTGTGGYNVMVVGLDGDTTAQASNANALYDFKATLNASSNWCKLDPYSSTFKIVRNLTVAEGIVLPNSDADNFTVDGAVSIESGGILGDVAKTGAYSFGSLSVESGGTFIATSNTTTIGNVTQSAHAGTRGFCVDMNGGTTFTHNSGLITFTGTQNISPSYRGAATYNNVTFAQSGSITYMDTETGDNWIIAGTLTINAGATLQNQGYDDRINCTGHTSVAGVLNLNHASGGDHNLGSLTIAGGGHFKAPSGTIILDDEPAGYVLTNSGTFTHNKGTVKITCPTQTSLVGCSGTSGLYNLTYAGSGSGQDLVLAGNTDFFGHVIIDSANSEIQSQGHTFNYYGGITIKQGGWDIGSSDESGTVNVYGAVRNIGGSITA